MTKEEYFSLTPGDNVSYGPVGSEPHIVGVVTYRKNRLDDMIIIDWQDWGIRTLPSIVSSKHPEFEKFLENFHKSPALSNESLDDLNDNIQRWTGYASKADLESVDLMLAEAKDDIYTIKVKLNELSKSYSWMGWFVFISFTLVLIGIMVLYSKIE